MPIKYCTRLRITGEKNPSLVSKIFKFYSLMLYTQKIEYKHPNNVIIKELSGVKSNKSDCT